MKTQLDIKSIEFKDKLYDFLHESIYKILNQILYNNTSIEYHYNINVMSNIIIISNNITANICESVRLLVATRRQDTSHKKFSGAIKCANIA